MTIAQIEHALSRGLPFKLKTTDNEEFLVQNRDYISFPPKSCSNRKFAVIYSATGIPSFLPLTAITEITIPSKEEPNYSTMGPTDAVLCALGHLGEGTADEVCQHIRKHGGLKGKLRSIPAILAQSQKVSEDRSGPMVRYKLRNNPL